MRAQLCYDAAMQKTNDNPTFQELRDGQQYRNTAGQIVKVHGPILPGQPIFTTVVETGENYYCSTRSLIRI